MPRYLTEFLGTFFLVLTVGLAGGSPLGAIAIGSVLMVMVYMGGSLSGAHYNPAVTLAIFLRGKLPARDVLPYMAAQLAGGIAAALAALAITGNTFVPTPGPLAGVFPALLVETLFTFALALVVLNVATTRASEGNSYFGLAIGFTVTAAAVAGGPISGGAFNPAVGLGPAIVHAFNSGSIAHVWLYIAGPFIGAALAATIFRLQQRDTGELQSAPRKPVQVETPAHPDAPSAH